MYSDAYNQFFFSLKFSVAKNGGYGNENNSNFALKHNKKLRNSQNYEYVIFLSFNCNSRRENYNIKKKYILLLKKIQYFTESTVMKNIWEILFQFIYRFHILKQN